MLGACLARRCRSPPALQFFRPRAGLRGIQHALEPSSSKSEFAKSARMESRRNEIASQLSASWKHHPAIGGLLFLLISTLRSIEHFCGVEGANTHLLRRCR